MKRHSLLCVCLFLFVAIPATVLAAPMGEENVTLDSSGNFSITPVNSSQPYIVSNISVLGALRAASEAGGFNYTVIDVLPPEQGYLHIASIDGVENDVVNGTMMNWTYLINGEQFTAGVAQKRVNDGDNVTFIYGPATDAQIEPGYILSIFATIANTTGNQTMNQTQSTTGNQTMNRTQNMTQNQTTNQTQNVTGNQTMNQTDNMTARNQTQNMTGNQTQPQNMTVVDLIGQQQNLTMLSDALATANLTGTLSTGGPYTVFAPDNEAFGDLGNDTANLTAILQYHVVEGNYTSQQLMEMLRQNMTGNQTMNQTGNMTENQTANQTQNMTGNQTLNQTENMTQQQAAIMLQTLLGENLTVSLNQSTGQLMVNNASVVQPDINASNGIIHVIDKVLMPENATRNQTMGMENATGNQTQNMTGNQTMNQTQNMTGNQTMGNVTGMPNVTILMPENGSNVTGGNVTVKINVTDFSIVDKLGQQPMAGEGHIHYYMDVMPLPTEQGKPAVPENGSYAVSTNTSYTWENVTPGNHTFAAQLVNNDHTPLDPPVTATVNVTINQTTQNMTGNQTMNQTQNMTQNQTTNQTQNMTGNQTMNQTENMTADLQLYEGWNFISIPKELTEGNDTIATVFRDVNMSGKQVYRFTQADGWETLDSDTTLEVLDAYWVYSNETANVTLNFTSYPVNVPASKNLTQGWSGVGLSDTRPHAVNETLQSVGEDWVYLLGYDARNQRYEEVIVKGAQGGEQQMMPMKGYWLFMQEPGTMGALTA